MNLVVFYQGKCYTKLRMVYLEKKFFIFNPLSAKRLSEKSVFRLLKF